MYINDEFLKTSIGQRRTINNPAQGKEVVSAAVADVERAIAAARHRVEFVRLDTINVVKPLYQAESNIDDAADTFEYYGGRANKITDAINPVAPKR